MFKFLKPKSCKTCCFWRDKGWVGDNGIGICDNPNVIEQVYFMNIEIIKKFVSDERNALFIKNSLRFNSNFCCKYHKNIQ